MEASHTIAPGVKEWGRIENRARRVLIIAAGPSLKHVDRTLLTHVASRVRTITVNAAWSLVRQSTDWFTLDFDQRTRSMAERCRPCTRVIAAVPDDFGMPNAKVLMHRCAAPSNVTYLHRIAGDGPWKAKFGLCIDPGSVHTGNSAWGALGVASHMKPEAVAILGVDGTDEPGFPGLHQPRSLEHLNELFGSAVVQLAQAGIDVINGSPDSNVTCFPRTSPENALHWIGEC